MSAQDLVITLSGKDVSASDAMRKLSLASKRAAIESSQAFDEMGRRINQTARSSSEGFQSGFGGSLASWAQSGLAGILGGVAASVTSSVTRVVAQAGDAILAQLKTSVIDYNSTLENATIGFTTMLGSGEKASKFLNELQDFGLKTPFQTDQLIQLSQQMMGYGVAAKNVIPYLTALGDATAASGRTDALPEATLAFEQMAARGRVDLADMNQLTAAGVPALKILAAQYHTTSAGILAMVYSGKLMSSDALPKLISGIERGTSSTAKLGGMMQKQSTTFKGAMSNISDSLNRALGTAFQPVFKILEQGANTIQKFTSSKAFTTWANNTGRVVGRAMDQIGGAIQKVFADPKVQASIGRLGASIGRAFQQMGPALTKILPNLVKFGQDALPAIIDAIGGVIDKIPTLLKWWERLSGGLAKAGPTIAGVIGFLSDLSGTLFNVSAAIGNFVFSAVGAFTRFVSDSKTRLNGFVSWVKGLVGPFVDIGNQIVAGLGRGIEGAWNGVMSTVQGLINQIPLAARKLLGIASPSKVFQQIGSWVGQGLSKGLLGSTSQISAAASSMATAISTAFSNKQISKSVEKDALADLKRFTDSNSQLRKLATERAASLDKLAGLKSSKSGLYNDTKSATIGAGDVTGFGAPGDAVRGLQTLVSNSRRFKADLGSLVKKGIDQTTFGQLVQAWQSDPAAALASADGLLANPTDLKQIIGLQKQLASAGGALGSYAAGHEYDSRIRDTSSKAKVLGWEMQAVARRDLNKVARETNVHIYLSGNYAGTKADLAKTVTQVIRDEVKKGTISKDWAKG